MPIEGTSLVVYASHWIETLAIVVSAVAVSGSAIGAFFLYKSSREEAQKSRESNANIARKRATVDLFLKHQSDLGYRETRTKFVKLRDHPDGIKKYASNPHSGNDEVQYIRSMLNWWEVMALGINEMILDEEVCRKGYKSTVLKDWDACVGFIVTLRQVEKEKQHLQEEPKYFVEFERLAQSWKNK